MRGHELILIWYRSILIDLRCDKWKNNKHDFMDFDGTGILPMACDNDSMY